MVDDRRQDGALAPNGGADKMTRPRLVIATSFRTIGSQAFDRRQGGRDRAEHQSDVALLMKA